MGAPPDDLVPAIAQWAASPQRPALLAQVREVAWEWRHPWHREHPRGGFLLSRLGVEAFAKRRGVSFVAWVYADGRWEPWDDDS